MITYKAMFKFVEGGVHAQLLDFPAVISCGDDLADARMMIRSALEDVAEAYLLDGDPLPIPDPTQTDPDSDLEEPVHLLLKAASRVAVIAID